MPQNFVQRQGARQFSSNFRQINVGGPRLLPIESSCLVDELDWSFGNKKTEILP